MAAVTSRGLLFAINSLLVEFKNLVAETDQRAGLNLARCRGQIFKVFLVYPARVRLLVPPGKITSVFAETIHQTANESICRFLIREPYYDVNHHVPPIGR